MNMDSVTGVLLVVKAIEKDKEEILFNRWLHDMSAQMKGIGFDDYKSMFIKYRKSTQTEKEEILRKYGG